jgi:hypothetical protein
MLKVEAACSSEISSPLDGLIRSEHLVCARALLRDVNSISSYAAVSGIGLTEDGSVRIWKEITMA